MASRKVHCKYCGRPLEFDAFFSFQKQYPYCNRGHELKYKRRGMNQIQRNKGR